MNRTCVLLLWVAMLSTCATVSNPPAPTPADSLERISADYWEEHLLSDPLSATYLGDRRYDSRLPDPSRSEQKRHRDVVVALRARLTRVTPTLTDRQAQITAEVLEHELASELDDEMCRTEEWVIDQMSGPQVSFPELPSFHTVTQPQHLETLLQRYRAMRGYYGTHVENLKTGLSRGYVAARINIEKVITQIDEQLKLPVEKSPYVDSVNFPKDWTTEQKARATSRLQNATSEFILPALKNYRDFLEKDLLPRARGKNVGVSEIPNGTACYRAKVAAYTGTSRSPEELHQLGLNEIARIRAEMERRVREAGSSQSVAEYLKALKAQPAEYLKTSEELLAYNRKLLARAQEALPKAFRLLPKTQLDLKEIEAFRAKESPAGYYYNAPVDGSRPAFYYLNTYAPASRPLYNMAALAFHEGIPGHHLQIALANENRALPEFQRQLGHTAFVEGWALYSERLAGELGLYQTLSEKIGALNYEMWRAVRLVVDTGLHSKGWTREKALQFFADNTAHTQQESVAEVERYIVWPGQALAYKVGQLEILSMREEAKTSLGAAFDLKSFHERLLSHGAVPPETAKRDIAQWVKEQKATQAASSP